MPHCRNGNRWENVEYIFEKSGMDVIDWHMSDKAGTTYYIYGVQEPAQSTGTDGAATDFASASCSAELDARRGSSAHHGTHTNGEAVKVSSPRKAVITRIISHWRECMGVEPTRAA